jgi:hypothetical protein
MSIDWDGQSVMEDLCNVKVSKAEVDGLIHASGRHDTDKLIEERIARLNSSVKALREGL